MISKGLTKATEGQISNLFSGVVFLLEEPDKAKGFPADFFPELVF